MDESAYGKPDLETERRRAPFPPTSVLLALALTPLLAVPACLDSARASEGAAIFWIVSSVLAIVCAIWALVRRSYATTDERRILTLASISGFLTPIVTFAIGLMNFSYTRGRALRRRGQARVPEVGPGRSWEDTGTDFEESIEAPAGVAEGWRINAATETASVAAFAHLANELLALGAPSDLVLDAHRDAIDEIEHARLCYSLAAAIDGQLLGPAPFPPAAWPRDQKIDLESLACECLIESCVLEAASAKIAVHLGSERGLAAPIAKVLEIIARDEARHAEHGWQIVDWCRSQRPGALEKAMLRAIDVLERSPTTAAVDHEGWMRFGLAGPALWSLTIAESIRASKARLLGDDIALCLAGKAA